MKPTDDRPVFRLPPDDSGWRPFGMPPPPQPSAAGRSGHRPAGGSTLRARRPQWVAVGSPPCGRGRIGPADRVASPSVSRTVAWDCQSAGTPKAIRRPVPFPLSATGRRVLPIAQNRERSVPAMAYAPDAYPPRAGCRQPPPPAPVAVADRTVPSPSSWPNGSRNNAALAPAGFWFRKTADARATPRRAGRCAARLKAEWSVGRA